MSRIKSNSRSEQTLIGNWHVVAYGSEVVRGVTSFGSEAEAKAWIASGRSSGWAQSWEAEAIVGESVSRRTSQQAAFVSERGRENECTNLHRPSVRPACFHHDFRPAIAQRKKRQSVRSGIGEQSKTQIRPQVKKEKSVCRWMSSRCWENTRGQARQLGRPYGCCALASNSKQNGPNCFVHAKWC